MGFIFMKPKARCHKVRKSAESQAALDRLNSFLEGALDEPVRFLVRFWGDQRTVITYAELRRIITDEDVPQDIMDDWFHDYSTLLSERITPMWWDAMITGYRSNPAFEGTGFQFNSSEENVRRWMADRSAELVTNCCREQQEAIRYLVAESISHQMAPAELARYIRPTIGLTERQAAANLRYYENMKSQLSENHPRVKPESIENRAREAAARYAERQQRYRAETIARTELVTAYHQGNDEAVRQAMAQNLMPPMKKIWSTSGDDKVCPACSALEGMEIGMDDGFKFTSGRRTMEVELPPAHPRCACAVMYVEEKQQETSEAEQTQSSSYNVNPEGENVANNEDSGIMDTRRVDTGGHRNEQPLDEKQVNKCIDYVRSLGFEHDIAYSNYSNTAFVGSMEGEKYCRLVIGTDVLPGINPKLANEKISWRGALAHEIVGHYEAWDKGFTHPIEAIEEAQASIRAARFAPELSKSERYDLLRDGLTRLKNAGIRLSDVRAEMYISKR